MNDIAERGRILLRRAASLTKCLHLCPGFAIRAIPRNLTRTDGKIIFLSQPIL